MSEENDSELLKMLQPDLLAQEELVELLKHRCTKVQNLSSMTKERLVRLFRQVMLPLPQRTYRTNRRGKLLSTRRAKSGLDCRAGRGADRTRSRSDEKTGEKRQNSCDRLKPCPDVSTPNKVRITSSTDDEKTEKGSVNDRRTSDSSGKKIVLKRTSCSSANEKCSTQSSEREPAKKQRTAIKWP